MNKHSICEAQQCTGCMACLNACAQDAIQMAEDSEGFLRPVIQASQCIECGKCVRVCPQAEGKTNNYAQNDHDVYACWLKDSRARAASTSGGAFSALAVSILQQCGVVFGAAVLEDLSVAHIAIHDLRQLSSLRGSKYVQSNIGYTFRQVKQHLQNHTKVLFSGTPCQIDALYAFLGERYENLLWTVDLVCHGVPSPRVYRSYIRYLEQQTGRHIKNIYFREKRPGWYIFGMKVVFSDKSLYRNDTYHDPFIRGFLRNFFLRPSCYQCKYANEKRPADITLADFWGYHDTCKADRDDDRGISMVMINTSNGQFLYDLASNQMQSFPRNRREAVKGNPALQHPFPAPDNRTEFWENFYSLPFEAIVEKYFYPEEPNAGIANRRNALKKRHQQQDANRRRNLPRTVIRKLIGRKRYEKIKRFVKG